MHPTRARALQLVAALLDGIPIGKAHVEPAPIEYVEALPFCDWDYFKKGHHGWDHFSDSPERKGRVDPNHRVDFLDAWLSMIKCKTRLRVPQGVRWGLKMPWGVTIGGEGLEGKTILGREQARTYDVAHTLDNPCIDSRWNVSYQAMRDAI